MTPLGLVPMLTPVAGELVEPVMDAISETLEDVFPVHVERMSPVTAPAAAYESARRQHSAPVVLQSVLAAYPQGPAKLLAVIGGDLFIPMLSFVFGQAQLGGRAGVISVARLVPAFYGYPADDGLVLRRARTVALHETGHLFGLVHCQTPDCAMRLATNIHQFDLKRAVLCPGCASILRETQR
jgi:archaemetzincin